MAKLFSDHAYQVGDGVTAPTQRLTIQAEYTARARTAGIEGIVQLAVTVDADGLARDIRVVKSLGYGLDEKAIEAVGIWRFEPGRFEGLAVPVEATIEIQFSLSGVVKV